ncbi:flagellar hook-associated protein FlgL [Halalkalibacter wakoensis JCM 9140]|uniref:Flagellar hook-associated protein FlgL n=1 Tax=Halalkalibacter wakoensis JCM 9140 TaxID=1236970 RepID=W4Q3G2_9BACI|nr:flagellar hook-associated protein FlgL [Halalkalibacter wakoensis]GAE26512.1 flagellar hook-associated protein FlgL [Halalkalibacter wakoensis JCM 9140]
MRVTQTMLAQSSLRHINNGYNNLASIQDQLATGKKITRASQDPVVAMKGMRYRTQVTEVEQFKRNLSEVYNWMEAADAALDQGTQALMRIRELATQAANDSYNPQERANIAKEIKQLREHLESIANTKSSNKYIFNGSDTTNPPVGNWESMNQEISVLADMTNAQLEGIDVVYDGRVFRHVGTNEGVLIFQEVSQQDPVFEEDDDFDKRAIQLKIDGDEVIFSKPNKDHDPNNPTSNPISEQTVRASDVIVADKTAVSTNNQTVEVEVIKGVSIPVNINPNNVFSNGMFGDIIRLERALEDTSLSGKDFTGYIDNMFKHIDNFVAERAELGARVNRVEMIESRLMQQEVTANRIMSDNEDADMEKVIIDLMTQESVHRAALGAGARIIQPSLMDFLR